MSLTRLKEETFNNYLKPTKENKSLPANFLEEKQTSDYHPLQSKSSKENLLNLICLTQTQSSNEIHDLGRLIKHVDSIELMKNERGRRLTHPIMEERQEENLERLSLPSEQLRRSSFSIKHQNDIKFIEEIRKKFYNSFSEDDTTLDEDFSDEQKDEYLEFKDPVFTKKELEYGTLQSKSSKENVLNLKYSNQTDSSDESDDEGPMIKHVDSLELLKDARGRRLTHPIMREYQREKFESPSLPFEQSRRSSFSMKVQNAVKFIEEVRKISCNNHVPFSEYDTTRGEKNSDEQKKEPAEFKDPASTKEKFEYHPLHSKSSKESLIKYLTEKGSNDEFDDPNPLLKHKDSLVIMKDARGRRLTHPTLYEYQEENLSLPFQQTRRGSCSTSDQNDLKFLDVEGKSSCNSHTPLSEDDTTHGKDIAEEQEEEPV